MAARAINKQHLINDIKTDIILRDTFSESELRRYLDGLYEDFKEVTHIRLLHNNDIEYGSIGGGKAFKTLSFGFGNSSWEFLDTLRFGKSINLTTDETTNLWLYRAFINYFIQKGFKLNPVGKFFAKDAHFTFTKGEESTTTIDWPDYFRI